MIEKTGGHHLISRINIENIGRFRKDFPIAHIFKHISWAITTEIFFFGAVVLCIGFCLFICCVRLKRCQNRLYFGMYFLPIGFAFLWWIVGVYLIFSENIPGAAATINSVLFFNDSRIEEFIHIVDLRHAIHMRHVAEQVGDLRSLYNWLQRSFCWHRKFEHICVMARIARR